MATEHIEAERLTGAFAKHLQIMKEVVGATQRLSAIFKTLPKGKRGNIFTKSYNRRPRSKQKCTTATLQSAIQSAITASQIAGIIAQPIPKYSSHLNIKNMIDPGPGTETTTVETTETTTVEKPTETTTTTTTTESPSE